jgi:hypothetical protein
MAITSTGPSYKKSVTGAGETTSVGEIGNVIYTMYIIAREQRNTIEQRLVQR